MTSAVGSAQWLAVKHEADTLGLPTSFKGDLVHDMNYLEAERPERFVWAICDTATQLFPHEVEIPSPFVGHEGFPADEYLWAFIRSYGYDAPHYYVYEHDSLCSVSASEAQAAMQRWKEEDKRRTS
jgi:hypothetical protein